MKSLLDQLVHESHRVEIRDMLNNPQWENTQRIHDWRNYIPQEIRKLWDSLSEDSKMMAYYIAEEVATKEDWE